MNLHIFVIYPDGEKEEIIDLFWFEEEGVRTFDKNDLNGPGRNKFEFVINDEPYPDWTHR